MYKGLFAFVTLILSCNSPQNKNEIDAHVLQQKIIEQEREIHIKDSLLQYSPIVTKRPSIDDSFYKIRPTSTISTTKFIYIKIETSDPYCKESSYPDAADPSLLHYNKVIDFRKGVHYSNVIEIDGFNEDLKFEKMDAYSSTIILKEVNCDGTFSYRTSITKRNCFVFDTYAEASEARFNNINK